MSAAEYNKGLLRSETDANGNTTSYTYDPNTDNAVSSSAVINKGQSNQTTVANNYSYENDKLKTITHNGFSYNFNYDGFGNQSSVSVGNQTLITNNYQTHNGNLLSSTYGNGATVSNNYDTNDRIVSKAYNGNTLFSWIYDSLGNVASHNDSVNNVTYKYNYDFSGRLTSFAGNNGFKGDYTYDKTSRLTALSDILGTSSYKTSYTYNSDNMPTSLTTGKSDTISYSYDGLSRLSSKKFSVASNSVADNYSYLAGANGNTTTLISDFAISKTANGANSNLHKFSYTYDKNGNILTISDSGTLKAKFTYDELNELTREDNAVLNKSIVYSYDAGGNLTAKTEYSYTTGTLGTATATHTYSYGDSNWKDKLTSYDGSAITYDAIGNPLTYIGGLSFTWQNGRRLATASNNSHNISYKYNSDGIRTSKTVDGVTTNYYVEGGNIIWQTDGTNTIHYTYDADGNLVYMNLNGTLYYYERNVQNDIVGLIDTNMNEVVTYSYDSWGKLINIGGSLASTVGQINPYRYRGYYYDSETGLFCVGSRYYDPQTGRWINADSQLNPQSGLTGMNLFCYCGNNPVNTIDPSGHCFMFLTAAIGTVAGAVIGGCIAAANGGNVWAGIGIGAVAGGLIGLGAGAAAGALLAGSATASTAAVMTGGAALVSTIGSGGLGAGATLLAKNLSRAVGGGGGQAVTQAAQKGKNLYYYTVTSSKSARIIAKTGKLASKEGGRNSLVYVLKFQPTLAQAKQLGARSVETVIRFRTNAAFEPDFTCGVHGALRSVLNGPINVFDVTEVGFK